MSHTKERWYNEGNRVYDAEKHEVAVATKAEPSLRKHAVKRAARIVACVNACANLPEPEKNIKQLVEAARSAQNSLEYLKSVGYMECQFDTTKRHKYNFDLSELINDFEKALAPFEEKK